jgi:hypothetical protein
VVGAYAVLLRNSSTFGALALGWTAITATVMLVFPSLHTFVIDSSHQLIELDSAVSNSAFLLATAATVAVVTLPILTASVCIPVAAYRLVVMSERPAIFPAGILVLVRYAARLVVVSVPAIVLAIVTVTDSEDVDRWADGGLYVASSVLYAATVRWQLALVGTAVGRQDLTFARSWGLTRGNTLKLFAGFLCCALPFDALAFGVEQVVVDLDDEPVIFALWTALSSLIYLLAAVVTAAYLSFVYLHFVRSDADHGDLVSHFR